jgi:hypothetical protein
MSPTAATLIALASIALAALTVLVNFLNVRRQAEAAMRAEHVKWLREKRDDLYGRILSALRPDQWSRKNLVSWEELEDLNNLALRYASDTVLSASIHRSDF